MMLIDQVLKTLTTRLSDSDTTYKDIIWLSEEADLTPTERRAIERALLGNITRTQATLANFRALQP